MISRDQLVEQSVTDYIRQALVARGYPDSDYEWVESFPWEMAEPAAKNIVCLGFNFDDEGRQAECGSDLKVRSYTIQFWVFGLTGTYAKNLANVIKFAADTDERIPLKDISDPDAPVIDQLLVEAASAEHQIIPNPEPWQEFVWTATLQVRDEYYASLV